MDGDVHKKYTGVGNELILENLSKLLKSGKTVWVRVPIIPGVNDTKTEMYKIKNFLEQNGFPEKIELLPYHAMGEHKYEAIGKQINVFYAPTDEKMKKLESIFGIQ